MSDPVFDHEILDDYRLSIEYVGSAYRNAKGLGGADRHIRDQWLWAAQSVPLNIAEGNGKQSLKESQWKRIVSILTRLIRRSVTVAEKGTEYEYRSAEYE